MRCHFNTAVPPAPTFRQQGFTLTEMAVVLVIVALLIGGMIVPISAQQDIRNTTETETLLKSVVEAIYGFAASHTTSGGKPYLPCPDTSGDGVEDRSSTPGPCSSAEGFLPWATLGLGRQDAWGNSLYYRVSINNDADDGSNFSDSSKGFTLLTDGEITVCESVTDNTANDCSNTLTNTAPLVVLSRGKNGLAAPTDENQQENTDTDAYFVHRSHDTASTGYDDVVTWMPSGILTNRMISAGKLP